MSEEGKVSLELINRGGKRKNLSFDLKKDDNISELLKCVVGGDDKSPMSLYVADLVIDNKSKGAENVDPIAKAFLYFSTLKNGIEYIKKLKKNILGWENSTSYLPNHFSVKVNNKLKEILKQNGIDNDDLDINKDSPEEISKKLSKVAEKTQNVENKKPDLNKVKEFLLSGDFEKGFKEFKEGKNSTDAKLMRGYLDKLEKNENPKFSKEEIKIIENFNPVPIFGKGWFTDKYSDLLDEQAKKDLGPQEYNKVYSFEEDDELVENGAQQTLNSRTDSNQISYSEFVEIEARKNALDSIFDKAIKEGIAPEESAKKVEKELKIENDKIEKFEKDIESKIKKNEALSNEEKEYLNKQKEFLEKRNKKIEKYVKNYGLEGKEITEQKANREESRRINEKFNSAITINQEMIENLEKISKNQTIEKRNTKDRKSKLEENSEHLQTARDETIEDIRIRCINERKELVNLMEEKKKLNEEEKEDIANKLNSRKTVVGTYKYCIMPFLENIKGVDAMDNPIVNLFRDVRNKKTIGERIKKEELKEFMKKIPEENLEKLTEILSINGVKEKFNKISEKSGIKLGNFIDGRVREANQSLNKSSSHNFA